MSLTFGMICPHADGAAAVSNLNNSDVVRENLYIVGEAVSFTTAASPAILSSVTVQIANTDNEGTTFLAAVWSDDAGHPGAPIETFPTLTSNARTALLTFTSFGLPLAPATTYWVQMRTTSGPIAYWADTALPTETSAYGWTIGDAAHVTTAPWGPYVIGADRPIGRMQIDATILPEPSAALAACGVVATSLFRRRRSAAFAP